MVELLVLLVIIVGAPVATLMVCEGITCFAHAQDRLNALTCDTVVREADTVTMRRDTVVDVRTVNDAGWHIEKIEELVAQWRQLNQQYRDSGLPGAAYQHMNELKADIKDRLAQIKSTVRV